jgi:hypothetical protein
LSFVFPTKYYPDDQVKKNKTGRACDTYGGEESFLQDLVGKTEKRHHLINLGIDIDDVVMDLNEIGWEFGLN